MNIRLALVVVTLLGTSPLLAATVVPLTLPEMVQESELIVVGTVVRAEALWIGRQIYTRYTVQVEETLQGDSRTTVPVLVPGGVDRARRIPIGMAVSGAPTFLSQERAVLLLAPALQTGHFQVVGFNQGRFTAPAGRGPAAAESLRVLRARLRSLIDERKSGALQNQAPRGERRR